MTTNPRSLAFDAENQRLICEECVTWTSFDDLYVDEAGHRWDICEWCGTGEPRPAVVLRVRGERLTLNEAEGIDLRAQISMQLASLGPSEIGPDHKLRIYMNRNAEMTPNKRAAHAVHAALIAFGVHPHTKVVVLDKGPTVIEKMRTVVHDAGHTELEPGTLTAGTNWPEDSEP
jgi:peptidyl-tRNA hydrolase, PTH2 family